MSILFILALIIFIGTYYLIITEKIPNTFAALLGGILMVAIKVLSSHKAIEAINLEVILLLVGMMIIVHITSETGIFQWVAIKIAQFVKGKPFPLLILLALTTAVFSAFLDNVTTILLIVPVTLVLAKELKLNPVPFILTEIFSSNIGGTATLIGDPPNILIGTAADISFNEFIVNLSPIILINILIFIPTIWLIFGRKMHVSRDLRAKISEIDASKAITNVPLLIKSSIVLSFVILGFFTATLTGYSPDIIAFAGAVVLMIIAKKEPEEIFKTVEWKTIFFFIGLFILVEGMVEVGFIKLLAEKLISVTQGNLKVMSISLLWLSGITSSIVDNIPYTATLIPMIKHELIPTFTNSLSLGKTAISPALWWPLSLGACLGGNGSLVGASANVVGINIAAKSGHKISFMKFMMFGSLIMFQSMVISTIYIWFRYLNF